VETQKTDISSKFKSDRHGDIYVKRLFAAVSFAWWAIDQKEINNNDNIDDPAASSSTKNA
jgi:hypothetical protein